MCGAGCEQAHAYDMVFFGGALTQVGQLPGTGAQVAVAPATPGSIPLQLVKANPVTGTGAMQGVTYIQRVATQGGVAPASACVASNMGQKEIVKYRADYIFWRAV